jgi:hypothetical protein
MITTFSNTWKPRTGLYKAVAENAKSKNQAGESPESWTYTRGIILRVLGDFPDVLQKVRDALAEARRACPRELLHDPA